MKKLVAMALALLMVLASAGIAEEVPFSEWIAGQNRVVTDVFAGEAAAPEVPAPEAPVPEAPAFEPIGVGSRGETVAQLQAKLIELGILDSKADGVFGPASEAAVKYTQKALGWEETGVIQTADELNTILALVPGDGVNLAVGTSDEWSEWMTPEYNENNQCFTVSTAYLGEKEMGDIYTCQIEIEFADVTATGNEEQPFRFYTQGKADDDWENWTKRNVWNCSLINLTNAPENGVVRCVTTQHITELSVDVKQWDLGFRCDYWTSGQFRVRCVKVEKGAMATEWSQSPKDIGDGINLAAGTSDEWSEWMSPNYNESNQTFYVSYATLDDTDIGDAFTCQVEIEFKNVIGADNETSLGGFNFRTQGSVDGNWEIDNIWNPCLVNLRETPQNGIYKYIFTSRITQNNVNGHLFNIGFRCDFWESGSFRVRRIKIEKGTKNTDWTPAP